MLSIVIPTFNEEKYLPRLLESIKKQSYKDYEIIVADNSKDKTKQIAKKYKCKVVKGGKPGKARNNGAKIAKYDLLFLDADDVLENKDFLKKFLKKIKKKKLDIATCKVLPIPNNTDAKFYYFLKNLGNKYFGYIRKHASGQCLFIKKELFEKINGYDASLLLAEEHDLVQRASKHGKFYFFMNLYIYNSARRVEKEGLLRLLLKNTYSEIYRLFGKKIKKKLFKYEFGNYN
jgi:glycosyltransferase involved in cell wall biosynthesis